MTDPNSSKLVDQYGRAFPAVPRAPQHNSVVRRNDNGKPVPAKTFTRREFGLGLALTAVSTLLAWEQVHLAQKQDERETQRERTVSSVLAEVFPFLFVEPHRIRFHPNADNQRLLSLGIGYENASPADHLSCHAESIDLDIGEDPFLPPMHGHWLDKVDLDVYSHMTLLQAHEFRAAILGTSVTREVLLGRQQFVRQDFDPAVPNVIVGSPTGNRHAAWFHGKIRRQEAGREREMIHEGIFGLHMPFEFALDADLDPSIHAGSSEYAWAIHAQASPNNEVTPYYPKLKETSFFTVSVLPNFLIKGDCRTVPPVLLLEGCTALGSSGLACLWSHESIGTYGALTALQQHLKPRSSPYWQALFQVSGVESRQNVLGKPEDYASYVEFKDFAWIRPDNDLLQYGALVRASMRDISQRLYKR